MKKLLLAISAVLLSSCLPVKQEHSDVKYGAYGDRWTNMLSFPDGSTIRACMGIREAEFRRAVKIWADAAKIQFNIVKDCEDPDIIVYTHNTPGAVEGCAKGNNKTAYAQFYSTPMYIVECREYNPKNFEQLYLHEMGHIVGLCDQYGDAPKNCPVQKSIVPKTVMMEGSHVIQNLMPDDIEGVRAQLEIMRKNR